MVLARFRQIVCAAIACSLVAAVVPTAQARTPRIINGHKMSQSVFDGRWKPSVQILNTQGEDVVPFDQFFCGGMLIDTRLVLTAGHCVAGQSPASMRVVVGDRTLRKQAVTTSYEVQDIIMRPVDATFFAGFDWRADIAVIRLKDPVVGTPPAAIVGAADTAWWGNGSGLPAGAEIAGWGLMNYRDLGQRIPGVIRTAHVPILADTTCRASNPGYGFSAATMLCAGVPDSDPHPINTNGVGSCYGDSGSALLVPDNPAAPTAWKIAGITSWGQGACAEAPTVFARVDALRAWIESIDNDTGGPGGLLPPVNTEATATTINSVSLSWDPPAAGPVPVAYAVLQDTGIRDEVGGKISVTWGVGVELHDTTTATTMVVDQQFPSNTQLIPGWFKVTLPKRFWVASIDAAGNMSPLAGPITAQPLADDEAPARPGPVKVIRQGKTGLVVRWTMVADNIQVVDYPVQIRRFGARKWRDGYFCNVNLPTTTTISAKLCNPLTPGTRYQIRLKACDWAWNCSTGPVTTVRTRPRRS